MIEFDHTTLTRALAKNSRRSKVLFAAMVAERLLPNSIEFYSEGGSGKLEQLRSALDIVWSFGTGEGVRKTQLEEALANCMQAIQEAASVATGGETYPLTGMQRKVAEESGIKALKVRDIPDHDSSSDVAFFAENAATAVAFALRAMGTDDPQEPVWAAQTAYDTVDRFVMILECKLGENWTEAQIQAHPIIQRELQRQFDDIKILESWSEHQSIDKSATIKLRESARQQALSFFTL